MALLLFLLFPWVMLYAWYAVKIRIKNPPIRQRYCYASALVLTLVYWLWESQAGGNIRVDLLLFYPAMFLGYILFFWDRLRWFSPLASLLLMAVNVGFFRMSYHWFDKSYG